MKQIQSITLDLLRENILTYRAKQNDAGSRFLLITLTDDGVPVEIAASDTVSLKVRKPDGHFTMTDGEILEGKALVELTNQSLAAHGVAFCDLQIIQSNPVELIKTMRFMLIIEEDEFTDEIVESTDEFTLLTNAIARVREIESNEESRNAAEVIRMANEGDALSGRVKAELDRITAEEARNSAEILRYEAEQTRLSNEGDENSGRVKAELDRITAEEARNSAEILRYEAEQTRLSNEGDENSGRVKAELNRITAEEARNSAEILRDEAEQTRLSNEGDENSGRVKAELDRVAAEEAREIILNAHIASPLPHKMLVDGVAYNYGLSQTDGFVKFIYEEEVE